MSTTPRQIIERSFRAIGIYAARETPLIEETTDAINTMNEILDTWSIGRLENHDFQPMQVPLDINRQAYTVADGNAADPNGVATGAATDTSFTIDGALASGGVATFDVPRQIAFVCSGDESANVFNVTGTNERSETLVELVPGADTGTAYGSLAFKTITAITMSALADAVTAGTCSLVKTETPFRVMNAQYRSSTTDTDLEIWTRDKYEQQTAKLTAGTPMAVYYDRQSVSGTLYIYPPPSTASKVLLLDLWQPLPQYSVALLDTAITNLPQEYVRALKWAIAVEIAPEYGKPIPATVMNNYNMAMRAIRMLHAVHPADPKRTPPVESVDNQPAANQQ